MTANTANISATKVVPLETTFTPYYDDFDESKNFHRILFRPGYAVQARELTQLQTIMQNQIERFGNHIFQNGSLVLGGQMTLDSKGTYINLAQSYVGTDITAQHFTGNTITYASGNTKVRAYVLAAREATTTEPPLLSIKYLTGDEFTINSEIKSVANVYANVASAGFTGTSTLVSINDGIFYISGYFVKVPSQTIIVDKYSSQANAKIGLEYSTSIIKDTDDSSLLDPAQEASNYQAPGAARLQINFDLTTRPLTSTDDETFVELMRVENGVIKKQIRYALYSDIGDTFARRTNDESGSYTVRRFKLNVIDHPTDPTKLQLVIDPGKAYVEGYEYENISQETIDINRGRNTANAYNKTITMNHGNYLYVQNVTGYFDTALMDRIDIHSVPYSQIRFDGATGNTLYNSTKVGSARVRELKHVISANTSDANTAIFTLSLFDVQFSNLTTNSATNLANVSANGFQIINDNVSRFSANNNAYVGATLKIISGTGVGETHVISIYNGATKTINIADPFITQPVATSNISVNMSMKAAEGFTKHTVQTGSTFNANGNINLLSHGGGTAAGDVFLTDTTYRTLLYPFDESFIVPGSIAAQSYQYMGVDASKSFTSNSVTITLTTGEQFVGATDTTGKSTSTLSSFMAFRKTGEKLNFSTVTVVNSGTPTATLVNSDNYSGAAVIYYLVNLTSGAKVGPKSKTLVTANSSAYIPTNASTMTDIALTSAGTTTTVVYEADGQITVTNPTNVPNEWMSLFIADGRKISAIYDLNGAAFPASKALLSAYSDVTSKYQFDNGQRAGHYDHARIALKSRNTRVAGPLVVCMDYYTHSGPGAQDGFGYFTVDSYPNASTTGYNDIGMGRDMIDFRPKRINSSNTTPGYTIVGPGTTVGSRIPFSGSTWEANYNYYLGRKALLSLSKSKDAPFRLIDGTASKNPIEPKKREGEMILYKFNIPPYTMSAANVGIEFVENRRYTMRDIGTLETRIENLEYYQSLTLLEKQVSSMKILDSNGLERTKYGMLADDFTDHGYGAVDNEDYLISVNRAIGGLNPAQNSAAMLLNNVSSSGIVTVGDKTLLSYSEVAFITQNVATKWAQVQPYMVAQYVGVIEMNPPDDMWVDTVKAPDIILNSDGKNLAIVASNNMVHSATVVIPTAQGKPTSNIAPGASRSQKARAKNVFTTEHNQHLLWHAGKQTRR